MFGPVKQPDRRNLARGQSAIVGDEALPARPAQRPFDHRVPPAFHDEGMAVVDLGLDPALFRGQIGQPRRQVDLGQRRAPPPRSAPLGPEPRRTGCRRSAARSPAPRSPAFRIRVSSVDSSTVVNRTWPAVVWRWMNRSDNGGDIILLGMGRRGFDEIAQHVVVLDLQARRPRFLRRTRACIPAITPRPSSRSLRASSSASSKPGATKPPSRTSNGGSATRAASSNAESAPCPCRPSPASTSSSGPLRHRARRPAPPPPAPPEIAARSRGPPRSSASRDSARSMSGTVRRSPRRSSRSPAFSPRCRTAACRAADHRQIARRRRDPPLQQPRAPGRHRPVHHRQAARPRARPTALGSVPGSAASPRRSAPRRRRISRCGGRMQRQLAALGQLQVVGQRPQCGHLCPPEGAESIERAHPEQRLQPRPRRPCCRNSRAPRASPPPRPPLPARPTPRPAPRPPTARAARSAPARPRAGPAAAASPSVRRSRYPPRPAPPRPAPRRRRRGNCAAAPPAGCLRSRCRA